MKYGKLTPLAFALGMLFAGQSLAGTVVWDKGTGLNSATGSLFGSDLSIQIGPGDNTCDDYMTCNYGMQGVSKLPSTPIWGTVTTQEGVKYSLWVGQAVMYIDKFIDRADGIRRFGNRSSQETSLTNSYIREAGTGELWIANNTIKNVSVKEGAELTRLSFEKVLSQYGDKNTIELLENSGTIQSIFVAPQGLNNNTASKIEEIKNHGTIGNISSINIGTLSSDAGSIKSITMPNFQIDKIDLKGTALGDATASRADGANGILVTGTGKIGTDRATPSRSTRRARLPGSASNR